MSSLKSLIQRPICAVCNKLVDDIRSMYDPMRDVIHYRVWCHGSTEQDTLDAATMEGSISVEFGKAFTKPELTND